MASTARATNPDYALMLGRMGFKVLPCCWSDSDGNCDCGWNHDAKEVGKAPRVRAGIKAASSEAPTITRIWQDIPNANVAIDLTGYIMVDPDTDAAS